jgi:hypothetical protein
MVIAGIKDIVTGPIPVLDAMIEPYHFDLFASKGGNIIGVGFDYVEKTGFNLGKVLSGQSVNGAFKSVAPSSIFTAKYDMLILKSLDTNVVERAIPIMKSYVGSEHYYQLYGKGAYNCQDGAGEILSKIGSN